MTATMTFGYNGEPCSFHGSPRLVARLARRDNPVVPLHHLVEVVTVDGVEHGLAHVVSKTTLFSRQLLHDCERLWGGYGGVS